MDEYTVYVVGWLGYLGQSVIRITKSIPDRHWFGEEPQIIKEHRGERVDNLIKVFFKVAIEYPWKTIYRAFPGANGNTFIAWIAKQVSELELELTF